MFENLQKITQEYKETEALLLDPAIFSDYKKMKEVSRKLNNQKKIYELSQKYIQAYNELNEAKEVLNNSDEKDLLELAKLQIDEAQKILDDLEDPIKQELLPKDPNDDKDIFLEIRPAAWWDEAWLFANELLRCYLLYCDQVWWKYEQVELQLSDIWWLKLGIYKIIWDRVYSQLKFEAWVHRVQRVPDTESQWRVHTSTVTVAIMAEIEDIDFHIDPADVELDTYAASSSWWQNANKNQTWVRLRHIPTGTIVTIWDSKSQLQNKEKAREVLRSRLYQVEYEKKQAEERASRWSQIGSWERSEKIRTYNYPQDRITDHRIKQSWSNLPFVMLGNIQPIIDALILADQNNALGNPEWDDN